MNIHIKTDHEMRRIYSSKPMTIKQWNTRPSSPPPSDMRDRPTTIALLARKLSRQDEHSSSSSSVNTTHTTHWLNFCWWNQLTELETTHSWYGHHKHIHRPRYHLLALSDLILCVWQRRLERVAVFLKSILVNILTWRDGFLSVSGSRR